MNTFFYPQELPGSIHLFDLDGVLWNLRNRKALGYGPLYLSDYWHVKNGRDFEKWFMSLPENQRETAAEWIAHERLEMAIGIVTGEQSIALPTFYEAPTDLTAVMKMANGRNVDKILRLMDEIYWIACTDSRSNPLVLFEDTLEYLDAIKAGGGLMAVISGHSKSVNNKLEMFGLSEYFPSITTKYAINRDQGLIYDFLPVGNHGDEGTRSSNIRRFLSRMADHYRVPVLDLQQRTTYYGDRINDPHVVENIPGVKMVWRNSLTIAEQISKIRPPFVDAPTKAIEDFERSLNQLMYDEKRVIQVNDFRDERLPAFAGINSPPLPPIPGWAPYMLP